MDAADRIERTGIALVHEGEWIVPAPGSAAELRADARAPAPRGQVVNYHFPVEVELVGELSERQRRALADHVYDELDAALRSQG